MSTMSIGFRRGGRNNDNHPLADFSPGLQGQGWKGAVFQDVASVDQPISTVGDVVHVQAIVVPALASQHGAVALTQGHAGPLPPVALPDRLGDPLPAAHVEYGLAGVLQKRREKRDDLFGQAQMVVVWRLRVDERRSQGQDFRA